MKDFKILIPSQTKDAEEMEAEFQGRDERTRLGFVKAKESKSSKESSSTKESKESKDGKEADKKREWKPLEFEDAPVKVGEPILSVGLLPEDAAYKSYFTERRCRPPSEARCRRCWSSGGLAGVGSPVFNAEGKAIGIVAMQQGQNLFLNLSEAGTLTAALSSPPKFFTPTRDFRQSLEDPPVAGKPLKLPWLGVPEMTGLNKDVADVFGLTDEPAVQVGEVVADAPAAKAGLKQGDIIVKLDGQPLERGDEPIELPMIFNRKILRMKVGQEVTLSVIHKQGQEPKDVKVTLAERPTQPSAVKRFWAEDLGFGVRDLTFYDTYFRHLPLDTKGVAISLIKPQGSAQSGGLQRIDLITQLNGQPVDGADQFKKVYAEARKEKPKEAIVLVVRRDGREDTVRIEPPQ